MRSPAVAGQFYHYDRARLALEVDGYLKTASQAELQGVKAIVAPHAGYMYSGQTAAYSYSAIPRSFKGTFVIAGPNHTGMGDAISLSHEDWETPLGIARIDSELAHEIMDASNSFAHSEIAHTSEHSIEVQLPFLQRLFGRIDFVPICMGDQTIEAAHEVAHAISEAAKRTGRKILFIASSDFTHYEPAERAKEKDDAALELIRKMDEAAFENLVHSRDLSICGHGPIAAAIAYAKAQGAKEGRLLNYSNSGDASGDYGSVVAYASVAFI